MYEMYPVSWGAALDRSTTAEPRPRRRPRRAHCVLPPVLVRHLEAEAVRPAR